MSDRKNINNIYDGLLRRRMTREEALRSIAAGVVAGTVGLEACSSERKPQTEVPAAPAAGGRVTLRRNMRNGDEVSLLGFGCMRFPTVGGDRYTGTIDEEPTLEMLDYAYAHGVNYFDTAWMYHGGKSEEMVGKALKRYPRESFFLADKMPPTAKTLEEAKEIFSTQLERCGVEYFDYYLCHSISRQYVFQNLYIDEGVLDYLLELKAEGRIRNLGFSFHGDMALFEWLLSQPVEWDFVQIQMNWLDWRDRKLQAERLYTMLAERKIPVIVMEPIRGGALIDLPASVRSLLASADASLTPAAWALKFCASYPYVLTVLSGMTYMEHLQDNIRTYSPLVPLTEEENEFLYETAELMLRYPTIPCNDCQYCMPCPYGLDIPGILLHYNKCVNEGNLPASSGDENYRKARRAYLVGYLRSVEKERQADRCTGCKQCNPHCPQSIDIPREMRRIDEFTEKLKQKLEF